MLEAGAGRTVIHVRSLWFLLMYASEMLDVLKSEDREAISAGERDEDLLDAVGEVLVADADRRLRSMLARGYRTRSANLTRVRGRVDHLRTATGRLMDAGRVACTFSEQTWDLPRYRYVLVTLRLLAGAVSSPALRRRCTQAAQTFERMGVVPKDPTSPELSREQIGRHDSADTNLLRLSRLVRSMSLPVHRDGSTILPVFRRDERRLRELFEKALRGYYRHHLGGNGWTVNSTSMSWPASGSEVDLGMLPLLRTDIVLRRHTQQIVVECKFTSPFSEYRGATKVNAGYLRQLYAYCDILSRHEQCQTSGLLLAAKTNFAGGRDLDVRIGDYPMRVRAIDLSVKPSEIRRSLDAAIEWS